jgi:hypothetical protein
MTPTLTYQQRVREAVSDPKWQTFRLSLKGLPTEEKVTKLVAYLGSHKPPRHSAEAATLQVRNYLNALARAGLVRVSYTYAEGKAYLNDVEILR